VKKVVFWRVLMSLPEGEPQNGLKGQKKASQKKKREKRREQSNARTRGLVGARDRGWGVQKKNVISFRGRVQSGGNRGG